MTFGSSKLALSRHATGLGVSYPPSTSCPQLQWPMHTPLVCCGGENVHEVRTASSLAKGRISIYRVEPGFPIVSTKRASTSKSGASVGGSNMQQQLIITPSHRRFKCPGDVQGSLAGIGRGGSLSRPDCNAWESLVHAAGCTLQVGLAICTGTAHFTRPD
jgi:hypothetical protein